MTTSSTASGSCSSSNRWVTLTGAPGCGKTLVARHTAGGPRRPSPGWPATSTPRADVARHRLPGRPRRRGGARRLARRWRSSGPSTASDVLLVLDGVDAIDGLGRAAQRPGRGRRRLAAAVHRHHGGGATPRAACCGCRRCPSRRRGQPLEGPAVELLLARVAAAGGHSVDLDQHDATLRRLLRRQRRTAVAHRAAGRPDRPRSASATSRRRAPWPRRSAAPTTCSTPASSSASAGWPSIGRPVGLDVARRRVRRRAGRRRSSSPSALARRSLVEVQPDGRFDMLPPMREVGRALAEDTDDAAQALEPGCCAGPTGSSRRTSTPGRPTSRSSPSSPWSTPRSARPAPTTGPGPRATRWPTAPSPSLSTAMRAREAVDLMEAALASGDGPPIIGSQLARRAGICASEVRGTYEGLRLLDRAEEHASALDQRDARPRAGPQRRDPRRDAPRRRRPRLGPRRRRADPALGGGDPYVIRQVRRTLMDVCVSARRLRRGRAAGRPHRRLAPGRRAVDRPVGPHPAGQDRLGAGPARRGGVAGAVRPRPGRRRSARTASRCWPTRCTGMVTGGPGLEVDAESLPWAVRLVRAAPGGARPARRRRRQPRPPAGPPTSWCSPTAASSGATGSRPGCSSPMP